MPFTLKRKGSRYQIVNSDTGNILSTTSRPIAEKRLALLQSIERDWQPTPDGAYQRTVNGRTVKLRIK